MTCYRPLPAPLGEDVRPFECAFGFRFFSCTLFFSRSLLTALFHHVSREFFPVPCWDFFLQYCSFGTLLSSLFLQERDSLPFFILATVYFFPFFRGVFGRISLFPTAIRTFPSLLFLPFFNPFFWWLVGIIPSRGTSNIFSFFLVVGQRPPPTYGSLNSFPVLVRELIFCSECMQTLPPQFGAIPVFPFASLLSSALSSSVGSFPSLWTRRPPASIRPSFTKECLFSFPPSFPPPPLKPIDSCFHLPALKEAFLS